MKTKQYSFWKNPPKSHGKQRQGRKCARPIATKKPMHIVMRASRATGEWNMLRAAHQARVQETMERTARRFNVRVYSFANVGNHCHLLIQVARRDDLRNFLRVFAQAVMFLVTGAKKGTPKGKFWDFLAFSRIVEWGRDWRTACDYLEKNIYEARGIPRDLVDAWIKRRWDALKSFGVT